MHGDGRIITYSFYLSATSSSLLSVDRLCSLILMTIDKYTLITQTQSLVLEREKNETSVYICTYMPILKNVTGKKLVVYNRR